ncbi:hypothetical protein XA68_13686 [Ophiocordyceps unilateralis]|uniref:Large ribosomal subunit protein uL23m n=1 Tax=Ophiocordyceps unilateralis TaxID=268505 RepID=A0A2A9PB52_OPHUN|nr:hypothetical protein XA68_13686 [Ophiocordyceps unilateralis]
MPPFKLGQKKLYLPNHVVSMVRFANIPLNEACFHVPLRFNKFDLRDYLWNVYGVEVLSVRSNVVQKPLARRPYTERAVYRPPSIKFMRVTLRKPFEWPDRPTNLDPWHHDLWMRRERAQKQYQAQSMEEQGIEKMTLISQKPWSENRKGLAALAKKMLEGKVKWSNGVDLDPKWDQLLAKDVEDVATAAGYSAPKEEAQKP